MELEPRREAVLAAEEERSDDPGSPKEDGGQDPIRKGDEQLGRGARWRVLPAAEARQLKRCTYEPPIEHWRVLMEAGSVSFGYLCTTHTYTPTLPHTYNTHT